MTNLRKKSKGVAFKVDIVDCEDQLTRDIDENLIDYISMLPKNFRKVMRILDRRYENNVSTNAKDNQK